ncbi:heavy metal translocating P-type ATPase metal-binding domain-containing protein [Shewanella loihica]|uniref:P-type Cu(2+) transporter n=1 Tax=Shewanella loihica (strain ATCC BAA-1088 / PV-4) TaxID=323850 RepID=A3QEF8_SHELP|nr:heavy metal translocating P-type ATPase metal-binding domain-containing protein [Shewanella loihica]ABO23856.1 heavy metal translocating P-type ATPase [Shewanella loihica PV-4]
MDALNCFHCGEPVTTGRQFETLIDNVPQPMCCPGCQAVSAAIIEAGLTNYYKYRTEPGSKQTALVPEALNAFSAFDLKEVQQDFVHQDVHKDKQSASTSLTIDGITCAACAWLIEHKLQHLDGINKIAVNTTTERAQVSWNPEKLKLSEILAQISRIGYQAAPYQVDDEEIQSKKNSRKFLLRLGLAGFATMQVMMFALALYSDYFTDLDVEFRDYFRWVSMIFAAPVVFYSAQPFYFSAVRAMLSGRLNMDVSVSIAICGAYIASCIATVSGQGEVYFESVSMFTFFLLLGRYFEQNARQKASISSNNLHKLIPLTANLLDKDGIQTEVPAKRLKVGDLIMVKPGEVIAADGDIIEGMSSVNEAMLTGEQMPVTKNITSQVYAGTINVDHPIKVQVTATGQDQLVAEIIRLQEAASNNKPKVALYVDTISNYFTWTILVVAALTYLVWKHYWPDDAFWVTLSVLVATCPCALALATPTAVTCATGLFTRLGVVARRSGVFEKLPKVDQVVFDKTGTLTCGSLTLRETKKFTQRFNQDASLDVLAIAAAMESHSIHPIAKAFAPYYQTGYRLDESQYVAGAGVQAKVNGTRYFLGSADFIRQNTSLTAIDGQCSVYLADNDALLAGFTLSDTVREDAKATLVTLKEMGFATCIASGDTSEHVEQVAKEVGIENLHKGLKPQDKLKLINQLKDEGKQVVMFGDGVNDAPVLAGANLSVAMGSGADIAKNSADLILLGDQLSRFPQAVRIAKMTEQIIRQNLIWALGYNLLIIPLAVTGHVLPYIAAIGMSASSLIVVANSLRLLKVRL